MVYANVVPVRPVPSDRPLFTYRVPTGMDLQRGSYVIVPFRGRSELGIVWGVATESPAGVKVRDIVSTHGEVRFTDWQLRLAETLARTGAASYGTVLYGMLPKLTPPGFLRTVTPAAPSTTNTTQRSAVYLWYRDRHQAIEAIHTWSNERRSTQRVILVPTAQDGQELRRRFESSGQSAVYLDAQTAPTIFARLGQAVRNGNDVCVIGTLRALTLPFANAPEIMLDQEEHHAHKQAAQHPRYDVRVILDDVRAAYSATSPAFSLRLIHRHAQPFPTEPPTGRRLVKLQRPGTFSWLSDEAISIVDDCLTRSQRVAWIVPRRGYASSSICRSCGYVQACPTCGQRISLFRGTSDAALCHRCRTQVPLATSCPVCHSTNWAVQGLGVEKIAELLQHRWPGRSVAPVVRSDAAADISVDTYLGYHHLRTLPRLGAVILAGGDALLNLPDYSTSERAWQFLARLGAEIPGRPLLVQSFQPESDFWQRWLHGDEAAWYRHELAERRRLNLPPFVAQWIVRCRQPNDETVATIRRQIETLFGNRITITVFPPSTQRHGFAHRLLLSFVDPTASCAFDWPRYFPPPWQVDPCPQSWLD